MARRPLGLFGVFGDLDSRPQPGTGGPSTGGPFRLPAECYRSATGGVGPQHPVPTRERPTSGLANYSSSNFATTYSPVTKVPLRYDSPGYIAPKWDGSHLGTAVLIGSSDDGQRGTAGSKSSRGIREVSVGGYVHKCRIYQVSTNAIPLICGKTLPGAVDIHYPCLVDEIAPLFSLEKIGTHSIVIDGLHYIMTGTVSSDEIPIYCESYYTGTRQISDTDRNLMERIVAFRACVGLTGYQDRTIMMDDQKIPHSHVNHYSRLSGGSITARAMQERWIRRPVREVLTEMCPHAPSNEAEWESLCARIVEVATRVDVRLVRHAREITDRISYYCEWNSFETPREKVEVPVEVPVEARCQKSTDIIEGYDMEPGDGYDSDFEARYRAEFGDDEIEPGDQYAEVETPGDSGPGPTNRDRSTPLSPEVVASSTTGDDAYDFSMMELIATTGTRRQPGNGSKVGSKSNSKAPSRVTSGASTPAKSRGAPRETQGKGTTATLREVSSKLGSLLPVGSSVWDKPNIYVGKESHTGSVTPEVGSGSGVSTPRNEWTPTGEASGSSTPEWGGSPGRPSLVHKWDWKVLGSMSRTITTREAPTMARLDCESLEDFHNLFTSRISCTVRLEESALVRLYSNLPI